MIMNNITLTYTINLHNSSFNKVLLLGRLKKKKRKKLVVRRKENKLNIKKPPPTVIYKKYAFKYFAKFRGKHLSWSLFSKKVVGLRLATLLEKRLRHK